VKGLWRRLCFIPSHLAEPVGSENTKQKSAARRPDWRLIVKTLTFAMALALGMMAVGCNTPNQNPPPGTTEHQTTVTDPNGNVVSQQNSESHTNSSNNNGAQNP
jgi:hypothetical protein